MSSFEPAYPDDAGQPAWQDQPGDMSTPVTASWLNYLEGYLMALVPGISGTPFTGTLDDASKGKWLFVTGGAQEIVLPLDWLVGDSSVLVNGGTGDITLEGGIYGVVWVSMIEDPTAIPPGAVAILSFTAGGWVVVLVGGGGEATAIIGGAYIHVDSSNPDAPIVSVDAEGQEALAAGASAVQPGQLGSAAGMPASAFASAAQGTTADTAVQPAALAAGLETKQPLAAVLTDTTSPFTIAKDSKLGGIEASAQVTNTARVAAAGASMVWVHNGTSYVISTGRTFFGPEDPTADGFTMGAGDQWIDPTA